MRIVRIVLCSIPIWTGLICTALRAEIAKLPEPYQSLVELARAVPPEFTADALLRIIEKGRLADPDARRDLIEEAFRSASAAKFSVGMRGLPGTLTDTASGSLSRAYGLQLDALSLESRAVRDMLPLDAPAARKLFGEIARPRLAPLTCDDALVYDLPDFYQTLGAVVNGAFTQKERSKNEHLNFLADYLGQAASPQEVPSLAQVIQGAGVSAQQREGLWAALGGLLENMQTDNRSFSASLSSLNLAELQSSLEKYRQKNHACDTDTANAPAGPSNGASQAARKPLTPKLDMYWQSPAAQQLLAAGKKLRYSPTGALLTDADRSTPEWQQQATDYMNQLAGWTADQESSEANYYHEKCIVLMALIELVPPGPLNEQLLADYIDFIGNSNLLQQNPAEWFVEPRSLLDRLYPNSVVHATILNAFQRSGNPVLSLEVALERALDR
jgi:hypothetical protein